MELTLHLTMHLTGSFVARTTFIEHVRKLGTPLNISWAAPINWICHPARPAAPKPRLERRFRREELPKLGLTRPIVHMPSFLLTHTRLISHTAMNLRLNYAFIYTI